MKKLRNDRRTKPTTTTTTTTTTTIIIIIIIIMFFQQSLLSFSPISFSWLFISLGIAATSCKTKELNNNQILIQLKIKVKKGKNKNQLPSSQILHSYSAFNSAKFLYSSKKEAKNHLYFLSTITANCKDKISNDQGMKDGE